MIFSVRKLAATLMLTGAVTAATAMIPSVAFAAPSVTPDKVTVQVKLAPRNHVKAAFRSKASVGTSGQMGSLQDPPGGGCDPTDVHGNITANYLDHVLTDVEATYFSSILCTTTAAGQSMAALGSQASVYLNGTWVDDGTQGTCANCNLVSSSGSWACAGQANCDGDYWFAALQLLQLPDGWYWSSVPSECESLSETLLQCVELTNVFTVPSTY